MCRAKKHNNLFKSTTFSKHCYLICLKTCKLCDVFHFFQATLKLQGVNMGRAVCCVFQPKFFYVLSKINENGNYTIVYRSEEAPGTSPIWASATISMRSLAGDKDRCLQLQVWQVGFNGYHKSLGFYYTTVNKMQSLIGKEGVKLAGKNGLVSGFISSNHTPTLLSSSFLAPTFIGIGFLKYLICTYDCLHKVCRQTAQPRLLNGAVCTCNCSSLGKSNIYRVSAKLPKAMRESGSPYMHGFMSLRCADVDRNACCSLNKYKT